MKRAFIIIITLAACLQMSGQGFDAGRGINFGGWLSQSQARGEERANAITKEDVRFIAECGFDHIRIPIDEEQMFDEALGKEEEAFKLLHNAISWCLEYNLRVVVDLHILRSHYFNASEKPLFTDKAEQEDFYECWRKICRELKKYPRDMVAYELMNEPVADNPEDWNKIALRCLEVIRRIEPKRTVIIGANRWQAYNMVSKIRVPYDDENIMLSFHFYNPFVVTHYRAPWSNDVKDMACSVQYPGDVITGEEWAKLPPKQKRRHAEDLGHFDYNALEEMIRCAYDAASAKGKKLYLGEFGVYFAELEEQHIKEEHALNWIRDVVDICDKYGIGYAMWDYRGAFGLHYANGDRREELIRIITGR